MPRYAFRKLVRDKLPKVYAELNQRAQLRRIEGDDLWYELKRKFIEEATELPDATNDKEALTSELGDILRVLKDSASHLGIDFADVEKADIAKTTKKGGFLEGAYIEILELEDNDSWNEYYRKETLRFPELTETSPSVGSIIRLSDELGELGKIDRGAQLPGGRHESDSHHSFSLALIAYDICQKYCPELDVNLVVRFALVHDLVEIITGDEDTLMLSTAELRAKHRRERAAWKELENRFHDYPALLADLKTYEALDTPEAAAVYVLDKSCTIWGHFWNKGANLHNRGAKTRADIDGWHDIQQYKLKERLNAKPPQVILDIFERSHQKMREELFDQ